MTSLHLLLLLLFTWACYCCVSEQESIPEQFYVLFLFFFLFCLGIVLKSLTVLTKHYVLQWRLKHLPHQRSDLHHFRTFHGKLITLLWTQENSRWHTLTLTQEVWRFTFFLGNLCYWQLIHWDSLVYLANLLFIGSLPPVLCLHGEPSWSFLYRHVIHRVKFHFRIRKRRRNKWV